MTVFSKPKICVDQWCTWTSTKPPLYLCLIPSQSQPVHNGQTAQTFPSSCSSTQFHLLHFCHGQMHIHNVTQNHNSSKTLARTLPQISVNSSPSLENKHTHSSCSQQVCDKAFSKLKGREMKKYSLETNLRSVSYAAHVCFYNFASEDCFCFLVC